VSAPTSLAAAAASERAHAAAPGGEDDIVLPLITPAHVVALNAFYRRRPAFSTTIVGRVATISLAWRPLDAHSPTNRWLLLRIDGEDAELCVVRSLLDMLIASVDPNLSLDKLQADHAAIVLELALTDVLDALEAALASSLAVISILPPRIRPESPERLALTFGLTLDGLGTLSCELHLALNQAIKLAQHLDQYPGVEQATIDLPIAVCLRWAAATLSMREVRSLSPGDVMLVDEACRTDGTAIAVIAEHLVVPIELAPSAGLLSGYPARARGSPWEWSMEKAPEALRGSAPDASDFDDLPVRLVFELGRLELSLGEVRLLAPGAVLPISRPLDDALDIVANGRRIGRGTIVRIGDSIGVRVTRLLDNA
jgi:type III secretion protein Q